MLQAYSRRGWRYMKSIDNQTITLVAIAGVIVLAIASIFVYGVDGKDITNVTITGLLGFAGGGAAGYMIGKKSEVHEASTIATLPASDKEPIRMEDSNEA